MGGIGAEAFSTGSSLAAATATAIIFPFQATEVTIVNDGAKPIYLRAGSTAVTTDDWYIKSGESQSFKFLIDRLGLMATATACCRVGAWRY